MKKFIKYFLILIAVISFSNVSLAADGLYRLMHNDHDTLIIGTVDSVNQDGITITPSWYVVSEQDLNVDDKKEQLRPETVLIREVSGYMYFNNDPVISLLEIPEAGDKVLVSLDKDGNNYKIAWGMYKVDNTDPFLLNVLTGDKATSSALMEAFAIKTFVNSNGKYSNFAFDGSKGELYLDKDGKNELIYTVKVEEGNDGEEVITGEINENAEGNTEGSSSNLAAKIVWGILVAILIIAIVCGIFLKKNSK